MRKSLKIGKLDAAKRQIECAITLYFNEHDPVSIHTLSSAAYNVLRNLSNGKVRMLKDRIEDHIRPGMETVARELLNRYENFFKHANRDPDGVLDFNPDATEIFLWEACRTYRELTGENPEKMIAYNVWFTNKNNDFFVFNEEERYQANVTRSVLSTTSKREYFSLMLIALNQID